MGWLSIGPVAYGNDRQALAEAVWGVPTHRWWPSFETPCADALGSQAVLSLAGLLFLCSRMQVGSTVNGDNLAGDVGRRRRRQELHQLRVIPALHTAAAGVAGA